MKNSRLLKVGIAGMGGMGRLYYETFRHIPGCSVTALASASFQSEKAETGVSVYDSIEAMLDSEALDAVCVCTPTYLHFCHAQAALKRRVHAIVEKPLALKEKEAAALYKIAEDSGVLLFPAHVARFAYSSQVLRQMAKGRQYGGVVDACFARLSPSPQWCKDSWVFDESKSGLVPYDLHIHDLDLIVSLFGEPSSYNMIKGPAINKPYAEFNRFVYSYDSFDVFAEAAWIDAPFPFTAYARVYFERALAVCEGESVLVYEKGQPPAVFEASAPPLETGTQIPKTGMYLAQLLHFMDCIRKNTPSDIISPMEVYSVLRILERVTKGS